VYRLPRAAAQAYDAFEDAAEECAKAMSRALAEEGLALPWGRWYERLTRV
jgi:hypothetical protein